MKKYLSGIATGIFITLAFSVCLTFAQRVYMRVNGVELSPERKLAEIINVLDRYYVDDYEMDFLYEGLYSGFVYGVGDPYTSYLSRASFERYISDLEGSFTGVGLFVVSEPARNQVLVVSPIEGSPASEAGIRPRDVITKVDGVEVFGDALDDAVSMMKGPEGTQVVVTVYRASTSETIDFTIIRNTIEVPSIFTKMVEDDIGYIRISSFEGKTYEQFMKGLDELKSQGMNGLIIDVRNNPGGLLNAVEKIANELVPEGTIVYTEDKNGREKFFASDKNYLDIPLVILINQNSASASEILAGAVKDHGTGTLVGERTFGKGLVQSIYRLSDGSAVKVTISRYYTPNGTAIDGIGVEPDFTAEIEEDKAYQIFSLEAEEDEQLQRAIDIMRNKM
jgi:carboxyl-terminal processing protease